jgi:flagellin
MGEAATAMSLSIRTNISSLNAQRNLYATQQTLDSSLARLSSGYRITKAGDDAAGLGISTKLESQIRSYSQATRNANDGISVVQASEAALNEQSNILTRLRELAMQSASDGVGTSERGYIDTEAQQLLGEIQRIAQVTEYNGTKLLDGTNVSGLDFHVGIANTGNDVITLKTVNATTAAAGAAGTSGTGLAGALQAASAAFAADPSAQATTTGTWADMAGGAAAGALAAAIAAAPGLSGNTAGWLASRLWGAWASAGGGAAGIALVNATANGSTGGSAAIASSVATFNTDMSTSHDPADFFVAATTDFAARLFVYDTFGAAYFDAGGAGNGAGTGAFITGVPLAQDAAYAAGLAAVNGTFNGTIGTGSGGTGGLGVAGLSLASKAGALSALDTIDAALGTLSTDRAQLGATGNRLQSAINDIQAFSESLSAANSRIKDVDVAQETSNMSRAQILAQAGVSVLAQANQMPQLALKLLG